MGLLVDFVGIIYFHNDGLARVTTREVLIIDGSDSGDGIAEHRATINVASDRIIGGVAGWTDPMKERPDFEAPETGRRKPSRPKVSPRQINLRKAREACEKLGLKTGSAVAYRPFLEAQSGSSTTVAKEVGTMVVEEVETMVAEEVEMVELEIPRGSRITITGMSGKGVDPTGHNGRLPRLRDLQPPVFVDLEKAQTTARLTISNGKLLAKRLLTESGTGAVITQLQVDGNLGPITIEATDMETNVTRKIRVQDGTEIVIANVSSEIDLIDNPPERAHFQLYRKLSPDENQQLIQQDLVVPAGVPDFTSDHPFFADPLDHPEERCSNTCCAP